jgi:ubiquinone/menaquinone biosynthesis C-methylase UbiE
MDNSERMRPDDPEYQRIAQEEVQHYSKIFLGEDTQPATLKTLFQPIPSAWVEVEDRATKLVLDTTGLDLSAHVLQRLRASDNIKMLSLGSGPGGLELAFAREARAASITCIDLNPELVELGRAKAAEEGLKVRFEVGDLNLINLPKNEYNVVLCYASLHHFLELERIAEQIKGALRDGGDLITVDVCTRNGYLMWPETREIVRSVFKTLPARFRVNHTGYARKKVDDEIWEADTTSVINMECIRAQDIIPILSKTFVVKHFVPYFSLCRRLLDTMYGPNYDLSQSLDMAILNWIWALDRHYLESNKLEPETFFGIYTK